LTRRRSSSIKSPIHERTDYPPVPAIPGVEIDGDKNQIEIDIRQPKSPLLTSHRLSSSSLDNVNLDEDRTPLKESTSKGTDLQYSKVRKTGWLTSMISEADSRPPLPPKKASIVGLSGALPAVPWGPPPQAHAREASLPTPAPAAATRKLTSPFSWLSRNTSQAKETVTSPPLPSPNNERRNTASSITTVGSNPEMMLSKLEEGHESDGSSVNKRPARNSLRDRFKLLRMREEAGITELPEDEKGGSAFAGLIGNAAQGLGLTSPTGEGGHDAHSPSSPLPPTSPNLALPPGTASGVSAGPSATSEAQIDWDMWQAVVDEGPAAVARTSPEELNRAITGGIPNAIRGVVWQILAQSKNEELESVYRDLLARGTDKEKDRMSGSSASVNGKEETVTSSASSIHSDGSTPATTLTNGMRSPSPPKDPEMLAKAQAAAVAERKKKAKEDAASLQKLEKAIKRDLGARTSFSKFAASSGLQDGLFNVCKAYALFDEGVGYAQGMNFLIMPFLFLVRKFW
jgi:hypothetical protein